MGRIVGERLRRSKNEVVTEFRTGEILLAAERVFGERGYAGATVAAIARAAGVAKGTVYLYFRSKDEIFHAAHERDLGEMRATTAAAIAAASGTAAQLRAYVASKIEFCASHRAFFALYLSESTPQGGLLGLPQRLQDHAAEQVAVLAGVVRAGQAAGEVRDLAPEAVARAIFDVTRSVIVQRLRGDTIRNAGEDVDLVCDLVWKGISR
jgi:AcrR family transcriptional regulator